MTFTCCLAAISVTNLVVGAITSLVVDLAVVIEGTESAHLPERLVGSVRFATRVIFASFLCAFLGYHWQAQWHSVPGHNIFLTSSSKVLSFWTTRRFGSST